MEALMEIFQIYTLKKASFRYEHPVNHQISAFKMYPPLKERCFQKICMWLSNKQDEAFEPWKEKMIKKIIYSVCVCTCVKAHFSIR